MEFDKIYLKVVATSAITTIVVAGVILGVLQAEKKISLFPNRTLMPMASTTAAISTDSELAVMNAVKIADPAVVSITITKEEPVYTVVPPDEQSPDGSSGSSGSSGSQNQFNPADPFGMFGNLFNFTFPSMPQAPQYEQNGTAPQEVGSGSGFLVSADGLIVTNDHVVNDKNATYTVYTNDGTAHKAKVIAQDTLDDIALVKIDPPATGAYPYLKFGESNNLGLGQTVIAIGNALGQFQNTVSVGVVSGLSRSITAGDEAGGQSEELDEVIQTDAAINPGNSGGPLLDLSGNVIGVNVAVAEDSQSVGFALPGDLVRSAVQSVEAHGTIIHPFLGVRYVEINDAVQKQDKLSVDYGVLIAPGSDPSTEPAVVAGSPAAKAGLISGDIILRFDGVVLNQTNKLSELVLSKQVGDTVTLTILHKGVQKDVTVTLGNYNNGQQ
jgi:serine protease Do